MVQFNYISFLILGLGLGCVLLLTLCTDGSNNRLVTYPMPDVDLQNPDWTVKVRSPNGTWQELYEYDARVLRNFRYEATGFEDGYDKSVLYINHQAFVSFDFQGTVELAATYHREQLDSVEIRPTRLNIPAEIDGNTIHFRLTDPQKVSIEVNGDRYHNLFVFANLPEEDPPAPEDSAVIYFGPGVHELPENGLELSDGKTLYIAGGAVVYGYLHGKDIQNVTIRGRGILSGERISHYHSRRIMRYVDEDKDTQQTFELRNNRKKIITLEKGKDITIEGITILDSPTWTISPYRCKDLHIDNVKIINFSYNSDGIDPVVCSDVTINDVLIRAADDQISIKCRGRGYSGNSKNIEVTNSIFWSDKAHPMFVGPEGEEGNVYEKIRFANIDVLNSRTRLPTFYGCLALGAAEGTIIRDVEFENIWVEYLLEGTLIDIRVGTWWTFAPTPGHTIENIRLKNINYNGSGIPPSRIVGFDSTRMVRDITIENLRINGELVLEPDAGNITVNEFVEGLVFLPPSGE